MGSVIILPADGMMAKKAFKIANGCKFFWMYLGEDITASNSIDKYLLANKISNWSDGTEPGKGTRNRFGGNRIEIGEQLQETAQRYRQGYIDYVGAINAQKQQPEWFACSFPDKNPYLSKTFLYFCYTKIVLDIIKENKYGLVFIFVDSKALAKTIEANFDKTNMADKTSVSTIWPFRYRLAGKLTLVAQFFESRATFLLKNIYRFVIARVNAKPRTGPEKITLIHTFLNSNSFDKNGKFAERYFGQLPAALTKRGRKISFLASIYSASFRDTLSKIRSSGINVIVPEAYLGIGDIIRTFISGTLPYKELFHTGSEEFDGLDINAIVKNDIFSDWTTKRYLSDLLLNELGNRLKQNGIEVSSLIYTYENHPIERMLCQSFRKAYPRIKISGYQHSTFSKMLLNYFVSKNEIIPLPDRIITNGEYWTDLLSASGYSNARIVTGGAIRYAYFNKLKKPEMPWQEKNYAKSGKTTARTLLIATSIYENDAAELISKCIGAFAGSNFKVLIKCHPYAPFEKVWKRIGSGMQLPENFYVTNTLLSELLPSANAMIYTSSTSCIEAIMLGVPVISVSSDLIIDLDQLEAYKNATFRARSSEEIRQCAEKAADLLPNDLEKLGIEWKKITDRFFGVVSEKTFDLFVWN